MALRRMSGELTAAAGLRFADATSLFLEQYLDAPVEYCLAPEAGVDRAGIVEIGSLAAPTPGQVRYLMIALTAYLHGAGYRWVVCTAISSLRNTLVRLGLSPVLLGSADPNRLGTDAGAWGSYYEQRPQVIAGHLAEAATRMAAHVAQPESPLHRLWRTARELGLRDAVAPAASGDAPLAGSVCA